MKNSSIEIETKTKQKENHTSVPSDIRELDDRSCFGVGERGCEEMQMSYGGGDAVGQETTTEVATGDGRPADAKGGGLGNLDDNSCFGQHLMILTRP
ncbi:hypothetical protein E3N88_30717 [Mikania micrantha]|uniref:Uncharacterized protein n=1 Tax=Mikania micrantha TaxID=192012 RepID=A0A5N6MMW3_9ASTR|nr:hypothetical protein E3N88_30717 [Mikania micrantha]